MSKIMFSTMPDRSVPLPMSSDFEFSRWPPRWRKFLNVHNFAYRHPRIACNTSKIMFSTMPDRSVPLPMSSDFEFSRWPPRYWKFINVRKWRISEWRLNYITCAVLMLILCAHAWAFLFWRGKDITPSFPLATPLIICNCLLISPSCACTIVSSNLF